MEYNPCFKFSFYKKCSWQIQSGLYFLFTVLCIPPTHFSKAGCYTHKTDSIYFKSGVENSAQSPGSSLVFLEFCSYISSSHHIFAININLFKYEEAVTAILYLQFLKHVVMIKNPTHIEKNLQCINLLQYPHTLCSFKVLKAHCVKLHTLDSVLGIFYRLSHPATNYTGQKFANLKSSLSWHLDFSCL